MTSEVQYAKMICKSIDALTREIYLLRNAILEKDAVKKTEGLEKGTPPIDEMGDLAHSTGCG